MAQYSFKTKLKKSEFLRLQLYLVITNWFYVFCLIYTAIFLVEVFTNSSFVHYLNSLNIYMAVAAMSIPFGVSFGVLLKVIIFMVMGFGSNKLMKEERTYELSDDSISGIGETSSSKVNWSGLYKIRLTKKWLLLYQSKVTAYFVKIDGLSESEYAELKSFITSRNVKMHRPLFGIFK